MKTKNSGDGKKGILTILILLLIMWLLFANRLVINQFVINGIISGGIYTLIALGFCIIYKTIRYFHFAHGIVYTVGVYLVYTTFNLVGINSVISIILSILGAALLGVAINRFVYLPLRKHKTSNLVFLIASFGVFIFLQNLIQLIFGAQILTLRTGLIREGHHILGAVITDTQILIIISSLVLFLLTWLLIQKTKLGKAIRAVADDPVGARVAGINSEKIITAVFAIGSALAGAAGILISLETNIEPTMGFNAILKGIIASIIGGIGSIPGALLGGLFLGLAENLGIWHIQAGWKDAIAFGILILFLLFRPSGIMGVKSEKEKI
jgi:branched-chain amino acid transport system permease protein